jgi:hypothetical protein
MTRIAGDFFGKKAKDLSFISTHLGEGEVEVGDLEVVGFEGKPQTERAPAKAADTDP